MAISRNGKRTTIGDVAREADVSDATVSRVISGKGYVGEESRQRVMAAIEQTGYVVNRQARSLAGGRTQVVGLMVPDLDTRYIGSIIRGIDGELASASYDLMLYATHISEERESSFANLVANGLADGILLILPANPGAYLESFNQLGFPYVLIDHGAVSATGPAVGATNFAGAFEATTYLLDLGHRRIGFITGDMARGCAIDRLNGYRAALAEWNVPDDPTLILLGDFHQPRAYACGRALLNLENPPTAIFASNDVSAFGVMDAVRDKGLRIGEDLSIVGFDDIGTASLVHPPLTTVRQPLEQMGREAARMLLRMIQAGDLAGERIDLPTELVVRESCRPRAGPEGGEGY